MIKFCKRCLYSSEHPLGITFNEEGICSGCTIHDEKDQLNWIDRFKRLKKIINTYRSKKRSNYDCIVPVTGAGDSYYVMHIVKNKLKLNPLMVSYNKYFNTPIGINNLANLRMKFDADIIFKNVNLNSVKKITRHTLLEYKNMYWHILAGTTVFPVEVAINYKIPLIIWGAHQGVEQVGMYSHLHEPEMTRRYRHDHHLFNTEPENLYKLDNNLREEDLINYKYPDDKDLNSIGVRGIYLSNFIRWDPTAQHLEMIKKYNFKSAKLQRTFDTYDHVDCFNYMNIHDHLKLLKHGYSKVTDHVCREIRHKRISRYNGSLLVKKYQKQKIKYLDLFSKWLSISKHSLDFVLNRSRNKKYWKEYDINKFKDNTLIKKISVKKEKIFNNFERKYFKRKYKINLDKKEDYIIFGKGYKN